jgi:hypothetical protein
MSIAGYFSKRGYAELRMPKTRNDLGIQYQGPVLTGEKSVEQQQRDDALRATGHRSELHKLLEGL